MADQIRALAALNSDQPISEIALTPDVRYAWLDEDGKVIRSTFDDFGRALTWFQNWDGRKRSIARRLAAGHRQDWETARLVKDRAALSSTGKPPVTLRRVVLQAEISSLSEAELAVLQQVGGMTQDVRS